MQNGGENNPMKTQDVIIVRRKRKTADTPPKKRKVIVIGNDEQETIKEAENKSGIDPVFIITLVALIVASVGYLYYNGVLDQLCRNPWCTF